MLRKGSCGLVNLAAPPPRNACAGHGVCRCDEKVSHPVLWVPDRALEGMGLRVCRTPDKADPVQCL